MARLLGLRTDHPLKQDNLELLPSDPVSRAETAYSVAKILHFKGWEQEYVQDAATAFELPQLGFWQRRVLNTAVRFIGFPYVWGGTSELAEAPFGISAPGGFDCSGFVWRVYKLQAYPGGAALAAAIKGRTTYQMSGEVPKARRITFAKLAPGDVLFFGPNGTRSQSGSIGHTGIYLGARLDDPLLRAGRLSEPAHRLVPAAIRLGPPASRRSRPGNLARTRTEPEPPFRGIVARLQELDNRRRP